MGTEAQGYSKEARLRRQEGTIEYLTAELDALRDTFNEVQRTADRNHKRAFEAETELRSLREAGAEEREVIFSDLRNLLDELGMFSGARPESPHEVMCAAIEEVHKLKQRVPGLPSTPGSLGEGDPGAIEAGGE